MKEKIKLYGAILILIIFIPYLITVYFQGGKGFPFRSDSKESSEFEQKVIQMVSEEMSGTDETEALKAQAVIARTNLYRDPDQEIKENAENLAENLEKITFCVEDTSGEILTSQGEAIDAAYHAVSSKLTRNASEVPGQENKTYLSSVESSWDISSEQYLMVTFLEKEEMASKLQKVLKDEKVEASKLPGELKIKTRDEAGYVTEVQIGKTVLNGEAVKEVLGLSSSCFYFSQLEGKVRITTKGLGHGLGLSQYGANQMAKEGKDYKEILKYYYKDIKIETMKEK